MIVDQAIYRDGQRRPCGDLSDELEGLRVGGDPHDFLWIGLKDPTDAEFDLVNDELKLHPLAVEDAVKGNQRPKVELYDNTIFVVLKTAALRRGDLGHRDRRGDGASSATGSS